MERNQIQNREQTDMTDMVRVTLDLIPGERTSLQDLERALQSPEVREGIAKHLAAVGVPTSRFGSSVKAEALGAWAHQHHDPDDNGPCDMCRQLATVGAYKQIRS